MFSPDGNQEQQSASEILSQLLATDIAYINDEIYDLAMVTDKIDVEELREATQASLIGDSNLVREIYIQTISELME